ncbi:MAG: bifunctional methylenetetrahydrofolate dehydrogenase/methenyltetrahydrofolate cyclohydrolase FolD [Deltaproteobacteria bacterium]|nr:bifunctional methylenetetrahydrofolate dehydrogenase/methenyltetrahydrofolate cyclohydrolase FolD [Candidatus Zymogenaceae bacterium]
MDTLIDGKAIAADVRKEVAKKVAEMKKKAGIVPRLKVIMVGDDPASKVYVNLKSKASIEVGIDEETITRPADFSQEELIDLVHSLNNDDTVNGVLVQLPLPEGIDAETVTMEIDPEKDVDGITPANFGRLLTQRAPLEPCTPLGVMELLHRHNVEIKGKAATIVGRSNIVGKPVALMLMREHATITICHSRTVDLDRRVSDADILIAATGVPRMIKGEWIKEGAVVIDVGVNRLEDGSLAGDVDFDAARKRASLITPVPGGVGPMTIAMLMKNTLAAAQRQNGL